MVISGGGGREESQAPARGGLPQQDDKEMIKPTEKIDKRAKQLQLCKVGWGQISSCPGVSQSTLVGGGGGWLGSLAELMTYPSSPGLGVREAHTSFPHPPGL